MENVPGLLLEAGRSLLDRSMSVLGSHYEVLEPFSTNAALYGAATNRNCIIVLGYDLRCGDSIAVAEMAGKLATPRTVRDAISDLRPPVPDRNDNLWGWSCYDNRRRVSEYASAARASPGRDFRIGVEALPKGVLTGNKGTKHLPEVQERFDSVNSGGKDQSSRLRKLDWNCPAPTLRAGTGADRGSYQAARPIHPSQARVITVREAARLQGFPDWFVFHPTKWHSFRMVGNSVSPTVSKHLFETLGKKMQKGEGEAA